MLIDELAATGRLQRTVTGGTEKLARLVRQAGRWLRDEHRLMLEVQRPFAKRPALDPARCLAVLAGHLAQPATAAIVGTDEH